MHGINEATVLLAPAEWVEFIGALHFLEAPVHVPVLAGDAGGGEGGPNPYM